MFWLSVNEIAVANALKLWFHIYESKKRKREIQLTKEILQLVAML